MGKADLKTNRGPINKKNNFHDPTNSAARRLHELSLAKDKSLLGAASKTSSSVRPSSSVRRRRPSFVVRRRPSSSVAVRREEFESTFHEHK